MAHMDPEVLYKTVLPTLARKGVVLIGITTLDDPSTSFWGQMMLAKYPDGRPVFRVLRYSLVCDVCRLAGVETTCKHKLGDLPWWQSAEQHAKLAQIMKGHADTYLREVMGFESDRTRTPAFDSNGIEKLGDPTRWVSDIGVQRIIVVAVDPSGGGTGSDYAIMTAVYPDQDSSMVVRSVLSISTHPRTPPDSTLARTTSMNRLAVSWGLFPGSGPGMRQT